MGDAADDAVAAMENGYTLYYFPAANEVHEVDNMLLMYGTAPKNGIPLDKCTSAQRKDIAKKYNVRGFSRRAIRDAFDP
jgi:hypothetical protein